MVVLLNSRLESNNEEEEERVECRGLPPAAAEEEEVVVSTLAQIPRAAVRCFRGLGLGVRGRGLQGRDSGAGFIQGRCRFRPGLERHL